MGAVITDNKIQACVSPLALLRLQSSISVYISDLWFAEQKRVDGDRRDERGPLVSVRSSLESSKWFGRRRVMANRKVINDSYVRSLLMHNLCSSSSDEDDLTAMAIVDNCEATRCKNDIARLTSSSSDEEKMTVRCRDPARNNRLSPTSDNSNFRNQSVEQATGQDTSLRRDSNSFSFKAFLKNGTQQTNYHNTGARPKVYSSPTSSPGSVFDKDSASSGVYSGRNPTELPDFVQDHLVIEQCYLNHETDQPVLPDVDNLPDFALNSMEHRQSRLRNETKKNDPEIFGDDLRSFDLTETLHKGSTHRDHPASNASMHSNHFDLPVFEDRLDENTPYLPRPEHREFPFDLPLPFAESNPNVNATTRDGNLPGNETSVHKSLPDFLSDGPIHNRSADSEPTGASMIESTERRLLLDNERLHQQLETARRQISEKTERIRSLEAELLSKREVEHEETAHLEKAMEQVEDNLKRSTKRAVNAESTVTSLKKKIKALTTEISLLRLENDQLRARTSTTGQGESNTDAANTNRTVRRLAHDLFAAASSAEVSLRQLMSGVDNLRVLASTLENMNKIEDWTKDFLPDSDEDNAAGPAV